MDWGSSFNMNELTAAFLFAQLEAADRFNADRHARWAQYHESLADLEAAGTVRRPFVPAHCKHNSHLYRLVLRDQGVRDRIIRGLAADGVRAPFHFIPLHSSPAGRRFWACSRIARCDGPDQRLPYATSPVYRHVVGNR